MNNSSTKNAKDQAQSAMDKAHETGDKAKDTLHEAGKAASSMAEAVTDKARDAANWAGEKAGDAAGWAGDKARDAAHWTGDKADSAAERAGEGLRNLAGKVRDNAPSEGVFGSAADTVARGMERTGDYLRDEGVTGMGRDIVNMVKAYPLPALLIGMGLGYLLARATSSNRS